jgi:hypothetical protein
VSAPAQLPIVRVYSTHGQLIARLQANTVSSNILSVYGEDAAGKVLWTFQWSEISGWAWEADAA